MAILSAAMPLIIIILVFFFIIRVATVILKLTGMDEKTALPPRSVPPVRTGGACA